MEKITKKQYASALGSMPTEISGNIYYPLFWARCDNPLSSPYSNTIVAVDNEGTIGELTLSKDNEDFYYSFIKRTTVSYISLLLEEGGDE